MGKFWILILLSFFATNSMDEIESIQLEELEELPLQTFDEIFVEEWWDKDEAEDLERPPTNFGQNFHHQIDRQNTQIGQNEPNSTDQNPLLTESDHSAQIEPTDSDHFDNAKNGEEPNGIMQEITANEKRKIINKFHTIKDEFKQKGKYSKNEWNQIEEKIANHLKINRTKIYKWKKECGLSRTNLKNEQKNLVEKFDQMKAELKRAGFKNSFKNGLDKTVAKKLGLGVTTIYRWKSELGQTTPNQKYSHSEQKELMKLYYEIKAQTPKISDENIAKTMKIGTNTLCKWKKHFKRQQF